MPDRSADWIRQAERDLEHARDTMERGFYDWACFSAHQAAEKAVKAVYLRRHGEAWGHAVTSLVARLGEPVPAGLLDRTKVLDKHYIPTRYPNGLDSGAPADYYTRGEAESAVEHADVVVRWCDGLLA